MPLSGIVAIWPVILTWSSFCVSSSSSSPAANFTHTWRVDKVESLHCRTSKQHQQQLTAGVFQWRKNGRPLPTFDSGAALLFRPVKIESTGVYECSGGADILSRHEVVVQDVPGAPRNLRPTNITSRSFTLNWTASSANNAPVRYYLVLVTPNNDRDSDRRSSLPDGGGEKTATRRIRTPDNSTSFTVGNLNPFTQHSVQVIAVNDVGHSRPATLPAPVVTRSEPPSSPPVLILAESLTSTTIRLQWLPPAREWWHGLLRGYRLSHRLENDAHTAEVIIDNPQIQTYEIRRLQPFRRYYISLQAFNDDGYSPGQTSVVRTLEGTPAAPFNLRTDGTVGSYSFTISWRAPIQANGLINGYKIYCTHPAGFTDSSVVIADDKDPERQSYELVGLNPYSAYHIRVAAFTGVGEGPPSESLTVMTDTASPSAPEILSAVRVAENAIQIEWLSPQAVHRQLDAYFVKYRYVSVNKYSSPPLSPTSGEHELEIPVSWWYGHRAWENDQLHQNLALNHSYILANLTTDRVYVITISAATRSIVDMERLYRGEESLPVSVSMESSTTDASAEEYVHHGDAMSGAEIAVVVVFAVFIVCGIIFGVIFLLLRRRLKSTDDPQKTPLKLSSSKNHPNLYVNNQFEIVTPADRSCLEQNIAIAQLKEHTKKLYADSQIGLSKEYESIATLLQCTTDFQPTVHEATKPENRPKNRYVNVLPYDHSRVRLQPDLYCTSDPEIDSEKGECQVTCLGVKECEGSSDYINANFVDGYDAPSAYILAQAPLPNTVADFWRMIWDNDVRCVVMLTNIEETGRKKSEQYWPSLEQRTNTYGHYTVTIVSESISATYVVRTLRAKKLPCKRRSNDIEEQSADALRSDERLVTHYLYSDWPDHGRPDMVVPLLRFIEKSSESFDCDGEGPAVIHCSAGVGRSGCYIAIHSLIQQADRTGHVNVLGYIYRTRQQRMGLCQNESQYALIYDALNEYIDSGQTEVYTDTFEEYFTGLLKDDMRLFKAQVAMLTSTRSDFHACEYANKPFNLSKNRSDKFLPTDNYRHRVSLSAKPTVFGSDYINASYLPGYRAQRQYIVTQFPLNETLGDFWRMIWECSVEAVVIIRPGCSNQDDDWLSKWPASDSENTFTEFAVKQLPVFSGDLKFQLSSTPGNHDEKNVEVVFRLIPPVTSCSVTEKLELLKFMDQESRGVADGKIRPTLVMDLLGGQDAALICAAHYVSQQSLAERSVDLYLVARLFNEARPGLFDSDNYLDFHRLVLAYCRVLRENAPVKTLYFSNSQLLCESDGAQTRELGLFSKRLSAIVEEDQSLVAK